MRDFLDLSPVEIDYYFYTHRTTEESKQAFFEHQIRLLATFVFNANSFMKDSSRVKDPTKLYKISSEYEEYIAAKNETKFAAISARELEDMKQIFASMLN